VTRKERSKNAFLAQIRKSEGLNAKQAQRAYRAMETRLGKAPAAVDLSKRKGIARDVVNYVSGSGKAKATAAAKQALAESKTAQAALKQAQAAQAREDVKSARAIARQAEQRARQAVKEARAATKEAGAATKEAKKAIRETDKFLKKQTTQRHKEQSQADARKQARLEAETKRKRSEASRKGHETRKQNAAAERERAQRAVAAKAPVTIRDLDQWNNVAGWNWPGAKETQYHLGYEYTNRRSGTLKMEFVLTVRHDPNVRLDGRLTNEALQQWAAYGEAPPGMRVDAISWQHLPGSGKSAGAQKYFSKQTEYAGSARFEDARHAMAQRLIFQSMPYEPTEQ
jgi:hypothetical protein